MPKVSVLMPAYNTKPEYLIESVKSILYQTFTDFELIILDDGSDSDIKAIIEPLADKRIKFYKNDKNLGVAKSRNRLLRLAQGEYAAFQDSDDVSLIERLEKQVNFLNNNPDISIVCTSLERFPNKKIVRSPKNPKILDFIGGCAISQGTCMFRVDDFRKNNLYYNENLITSEDYELWSRAVQTLKISAIDEVLLKYRRVETSLCHSKGKSAYNVDKEIKENLIKTLTEDKKLQKRILETVSDYYKKEPRFFEKIFSIRNIWEGDKKYKILTFLGIGIKLNKIKGDKIVQ